LDPLCDHDVGYGAAACGAKVTTGVEAGGRRLELNLFSHIQGVVHLNSEISDGAI
jgi:hypothetical protein